MAKLIESPTKYHPGEWHGSNRLNFSSAEKERAAAERLRAECERLRKETAETTLRTQQSNDHKFAQRIRDIAFWKAEIERKLSENASETELVLQRKEQLERALAATHFPLEVAQRCLSFRESRKSIDRVHDDVEIQLMKVQITRSLHSFHVLFDAHSNVCFSGFYILWLTDWHVTLACAVCVDSRSMNKLHNSTPCYIHTSTQQSRSGKEFLSLVMHFSQELLSYRADHFKGFCASMSV